MTAARERPPDEVVDDPIAAAVRRAVEQAPPLTPEKRDRLRGLLNPTPIPHQRNESVQ